MRCRNTQGGRESGVCASSGSMGAPSETRVSTECRVRTRNADARWCMCRPRGSCACSGTITPPLALVPPLSPSFIHTYVYVGCASCLRLSSDSCFVPKGCCNDCCEGIGNMTASSSMHARMTWRPWLAFGRNLKGCGARRASGKVGPHGIFSDRKRYRSRQKAVTAELKSHGTMYRKELVSKTGTRLS